MIKTKRKSDIFSLSFSIERNWRVMTFKRQEC